MVSSNDKTYEFHIRLNGIFHVKKQHFVEAIWSKVDYFISQIFPAAPTKVGPSGDTNFGWHLRTIS